MSDFSIIITALNEKYTDNTIDSIIENTRGSLKEIIIIDDCSDEPIVNNKASKVIRNRERLGLIKSRNIATQLASSDYVVSVDPHIMFIKGWDVELIKRVENNYKCISTPWTFCLDPERWEIIENRPIGKKTVWGWGLDFKWKRDISMSREIYSPSVAGHCFAYSKRWWEESGGFDNEFKIWGGENIEFSLKTWLAGGEVISCGDSKVAHWFKEKFQYKFPMSCLLHNKARIAEVWFDGYKDMFYRSVKRKRGGIDFGDISERIKYKNKIQEKSFEWFLDNLQPELIK